MGTLLSHRESLAKIGIPETAFVLVPKHLFQPRKSSERDRRHTPRHKSEGSLTPHISQCSWPFGNTMVSLRKVLGGIGEPAKLPLGLWSSFGHRAPHSLRTALDGMADPGVGAWHELGIAFASENNMDSHEAQGMATDGTNWYLCSNGSKRIIIYDQHWNRLFTVSPIDTVWDAMRNDAGQPSEDWGHGEENPHFGALCVHDFVLYVPVQGPRGVWRLDTKTASQTWLKPFALPKDGSPLPENDMFAWCAVHPVTGRLYTSNFRHPKTLYAYDRNTLQYLPGA